MQICYIKLHQKETITLAITLEQLTSYLEEDELMGYTRDESMLIPFRSKGNEMTYIRLSLQEDGEYLQCTISEYLNLNATAYREELLTKLLELSRLRKILKFGLDPDDGEVSISIEIPIEDGGFTQGQLRRSLVCLMQTAVGERYRLRVLMETGFYPGETKSEVRSGRPRRKYKYSRGTSALRRIE